MILIKVLCISFIIFLSFKKAILISCLSMQNDILFIVLLTFILWLHFPCWRSMPRGGRIWFKENYYLPRLKLHSGLRTFLDIPSYGYNLFKIFAITNYMNYFRTIRRSIGSFNFYRSNLILPHCSTLVHYYTFADVFFPFITSIDR